MNKIEHFIIFISVINSVRREHVFKTFIFNSAKCDHSTANLGLDPISVALIHPYKPTCLTLPCNPVSKYQSLFC